MTPAASITSSIRVRWPIFTVVEVASPVITKSAFARLEISREAMFSKCSLWMEQDTQMSPAKARLPSWTNRAAAEIMAVIWPFMSEVPLP